MERTKKIQIEQIKDGLIKGMEDQVVVEYPLTVYLNDEEFITLLCSPNTSENLQYLALGFLISEGMIVHKSDVGKITVEEEAGHIHIQLKNKINLKQKLYGKRTVTTGCGKGTVFYNVLDSLGSQEIKNDIIYDYRHILKLSTELNQKSGLFKETGGVHFCALCDQEKVLFFHEDIGRHNALDKIIGEAFAKEEPLEDKILITSGRLSSEMIIKAAKKAIPVIVSRSAPTELSVNIAKDLDITLIGFARGNRMNIYHGSKRVSQKAL
ncbi:formate dehydrogenase accessory sulfurtransferase FdhD [Isachenkonia alkalipeptolytica]|uniref:Sulfur carrier protein FdhD n=1 Tax=Isachenkonia alkalipeptolytica TaxID=2565777 RepID=A0AA44BCT2_9CLOT|nr:formate dehydrogenase accessory sulfurtransferase FdhD [Isachenkonia alkalipeptolytica]NBG87327.1 formate dehydrogenase accessory sulfurtransferase FdhD [Isachenkonia alkalipeptolytica]